MKTSETILLRAVIKNGETKLIPNKLKDKETHDAFIIAQTDKIKNGEQVYIRAHYDIVGEKYVAFYIRRQHYWAYLHTMVDKGFEPWTSALPGHNAEAKAEYLHAQMKTAWRTNHDNAPAFSIADENVGGKGQISYEEASKRVEWMIDAAHDAHMTITRERTGEAWAPSAWSEN